ncbi:MAG: IS66 family transposase [Myxococcales bacterium]|nr:IS66 family transposase [Myxococcales bacterium]
MVAALIEDGDKEGVLKVVKRLELEIEKLQRDLARAKAPKGRHSEGITQTQLGLLFNELAELRKSAANDPEAAAAVEASVDESLSTLTAIDDELARKTKSPAAPPTSRKRRPLPASLPRVDNPLPVPDDACLCPECSAPMAVLEPEIHEVLDYRPGELFVRRDIREVRACRNGDCAVVRGPLGDKVVPGGAYGSTLVAQLIIRKYRDGMSLHRIGQWLERMGFKMPSASLSDQVLWASDLLTPLWRALLDDVTKAGVMQIDGTGIRAMHRNEDGERVGMRMGTLWGASGDGRAVVYTYASTAHKTGQAEYDIGPEDILAMRPAGPVVADADGKFNASFARPELIECGCSMHARRYFIKALDAGNKRAAFPIEAFKKLYLLERKFVDDDLVGEALAEARRTRAGPIWEGLRTWCRAVSEHEPPSSLLAIAANYLIRHYQALTRYLSDGRIPIDNGLAERLFRRIAIVRKNALFIGSHDAGRRAAVIFSIFATCEVLGVDPEAYLADVLPRLARGISLKADVPDLLPAAWLERHPEARVTPLNVRRVTLFNDPL